MTNIVELHTKRARPMKKKRHSRNKFSNGKWDLSKNKSEFDVLQRETIVRVGTKLNEEINKMDVIQYAAGIFPDDISQLIGEKKDDVIMVLHYKQWAPKMNAKLSTAKWYPPVQPQSIIRTSRSHI